MRWRRPERTSWATTEWITPWVAVAAFTRFIRNSLRLGSAWPGELPLVGTPWRSWRCHRRSLCCGSTPRPGRLRADTARVSCLRATRGPRCCRCRREPVDLGSKTTERPARAAEIAPKVPETPPPTTPGGTGRRGPERDPSQASDSPGGSAGPPSGGVNSRLRLSRIASRGREAGEVVKAPASLRCRTGRCHHLPVPLGSFGTEYRFERLAITSS